MQLSYDMLISMLVQVVGDSEGGGETVGKGVVVGDIDGDGDTVGKGVGTSDGMDVVDGS